DFSSHSNVYFYSKKAIVNQLVSLFARVSDYNEDNQQEYFIFQWMKDTIMKCVLWMLFALPCFCRARADSGSDSFAVNVENDEIDCSKPIRCPRDLVFAIDTSCFVSNTSRTKIRNFIRDLTARLFIGSGSYGTRVGIITYSNNYYHRAYFEEATDSSTLRNIIMTMDLSQETICLRRTDILLNSILKRYFTKETGDRVGNEFANTLILITNGATMPSLYKASTIREARALKASGASLLVVGFQEDDDINSTIAKGMYKAAIEEWEEVVTSTQFLFQIGSLKNASSFVEPIVKMMCDTYKSCMSRRIPCTQGRVCCGCPYMFSVPGTIGALMLPFVAVRSGLCLEEGCIRSPDSSCKVSLSPGDPLCVGKVLVESTMSELTNVQLLQGYGYVEIAFRFLGKLELHGFYRMFKAAANYKSKAFAAITEFQVKRGVEVTFSNLQVPSALGVKNGITALEVALDVETSLLDNTLTAIDIAESHNDAGLASFLREYILPGQLKAKKEVFEYITQYHALGQGVGEYILNEVLYNKYQPETIDIFGMTQENKNFKREQTKTNDGKKIPVNRHVQVEL
ncbi:unnamed protein product, partial [Owenia fusiformis]